MAHIDPSAVRNVAVVGHRGAGKTSLVEAMLHAAGATGRLGSVAEGTTVTDFDEEEARRGMSMTSSLCHLTWRDTDVTLIDSPGEPSFIGDALTAIRAADCALVVVNAQEGVEVMTERMWEVCREAGVARAVVVTMLDRERADMETVLDSLREMAPGCIPVEIPMGSGPTLEGVIDLIDMNATTYGDGPTGTVGEIPEEYRERAQAARERLMDIVAEADDTLIEKYLAGEPITHDELVHAIHTGILERRIFPVLCAAAGRAGFGADRVLDAVVDELPSPPELGAWTGRDVASDTDVAIPLHEDGPVVVYVFKTIADPFSGKLNMLRVISGTLRSDTVLTDTRTGNRERLGGLMRLQGKEHEPVGELTAGGIGAVAKLKDVTTGDVLTTGDDRVVLRPVEIPAAVMTFRVTPRQTGDEDKVITALRRLQEEDPSLDVHRDDETRDLIVGGLSQMHVEVVLERMSRRFGVEVDLHRPHVPYHETITRAVDAHGKHKKQSGGHGQFGECSLHVEPMETGAGFAFVNAVVGGSVPRQFIPAVEKGVRDALASGVVGGFPVVDVRVTLTDGKHHSVDSSEMAFRLAGALAMREALASAAPVVLEPIMAVSVTVPDEVVGDVMGDLSGRRGHPLGMEAKGHNQVVQAEVPMAEMLEYANDLRSMTGGRGDYTMSFTRYDPLPSHLTEAAVQENSTST